MKPRENKPLVKKEKDMVMKDIRRDPFIRLNNAFALMSIIPLLIFFYIIVAHLFTISVLAGVIGLLVSLAIILAVGGYLLTHNLLSELVGYAVRLRRVDKSRSKFIAEASHELKNPIFMLLGNIENLAKGVYGSPTEKQQKILQMCRDIAQRMNIMTCSLLDAHKLEAGVVDVTRKLCNMLQMVDEQAQEFEIKLKEKNITLKKNLVGEGFRFWADESKILQVINNLLANAVKYTPKGGAITITIAQEEESIRLTVHNTGPHIPPHELDTIFDKYKRLDASEEGAGLGLAITKDLVDLHCGSIWAESDPEEGNTFIVLLPSDLRKIKRKKSA